MALISGQGETSLRVRCGQIARPQTRVGRAPAVVEGGPAPAGVDILVNNRATDVFPHSTQSETSAAVFNKLILVGFNDSGQFAATGDFSGYSRSTNNGTTWTDMGPPTTPLGPVSAVFGDPVLVADRIRLGGQTGVFYFANLADNLAGQSIISVHKTIDGGATWAQAANASPLGGVGGQFQDKEWMAVDTRAAGGNVYVCWTRFGGAGGIQFSRSIDGGANFVQMAGNLSSSTNVQGCTVAVDQVNGNVYVAWTDFNGPDIRFRRSTDGGLNFGAEIVVGTSPLAEGTTLCGASVRTTFVDSEPGFATRAIRSAPFPHMAVNPTNGQIYVVWHRAQLPGGAGADIAFARSTDGGLTFGATARINAAAVGNQFFPSIAVKNSGRVRVIYYSTQNSATNRLLDVYTTKSDDGGATWSGSQRVTDVSFDRPTTNPNFDTSIAACYMGDYISITAAAPGLGPNRFTMAWGDNRLDADPGPGVMPDPDVRFDKKR